MESPISELVFSDKELKLYSEEFEKLTSDQKKPLSERELMGKTSAVFFRQFKIGDEDLSKIWNIASEKKAYLKLPNFMAAMRLCSACKRGLPISEENYKVEQKLIGRKQTRKEKLPQKESTSFQDSFVEQTHQEAPQVNYAKSLETSPVKSLKEFLPLQTAVISPETHEEDTFQPECSLLEEPTSPTKLPCIPKIYSSPLKQIEEEHSSRYISERNNEIVVNTPVLVESGWFGSSSYHLYTIVSRLESSVFTVQRRFRDLDWMHNLLLQTYKGYNIPPLPQKKVFYKTDPKFIEERRLVMEKYLNILCAHPVILNSKIFRVFIQTPQKQFEREKAKMSRTQGLMEFVSLEDSYDRIMATMHNKIQFLLYEKLIPFNKEVSKIEENLLKLELPTEVFSESFCSAISLQSLFNSTFQCLSIPDFPEFNKHLSKYFKTLRKHKEESSRLSIEAKEETLRVQGLKQAVFSYKDTINEYSRQETLISRIETKHRSSNDEDNSAKYSSQILKTQSILESLKKEIQDIEQKVQEEHFTFGAKRNTHLGELIKQTAEVQLDLHSSEALFWQDSLYSIQNTKI